MFDAFRGQKTVSDRLELELWATVYGSWEQNPSSLKEQQVLLNHWAISLGPKLRNRKEKKKVSKHEYIHEWALTLRSSSPEFLICPHTFALSGFDGYTISRIIAEWNYRTCTPKYSLTYLVKIILEHWFICKTMETWGSDRVALLEWSGRRWPFFCVQALSCKEEEPPEQYGVMDSTEEWSAVFNSVEIDWW